MATTYESFLRSKRVVVPSRGVRISQNDVHPKLFPFQRDLVVWAARKGRAAIFADCGMGKTFMSLEWARGIGERTLILAPLSVARQTVAEGRKIDLEVHYTRSGDDLVDGINITNYEMLDHFDASMFGAVVLDESSILKSLDGKTRQKLIDMFTDTPYRLCCTATPAPNDITEIANHAEFLGVMTRVDMLASFFVHDDQGWRLKGHAKDAFYRWLASWSMAIRKPSDLGYSDEGFMLPPLDVRPVVVESEQTPEGKLFFDGLKGVQDRLRVRRATIEDRVQAAADLVNGDDGQWVVWVGLNDEGDLAERLIDDSVQVRGSDSPDEKQAAFEGFIDGSNRVLITKAKIGGFGLNLQNAHKMIFVGLGDSFEMWYQCVRRMYRFGQTRPVEVYVVLSDMEQEIFDNVLRKEREAREMSEHLIANVQEFEKEELGISRQDGADYEEDDAHGEDWRLMLGDSTDRLKEIESDSVGLSVFSPPFIALYTYSPTERDVGNARTEEEFYHHFGFIVDELLRITMPGRHACVHVAQVPAMLVRDGYIGLKDFRGGTIRLFEDRGWIFHGEVCIDKDPQAQAIRTKSKGLLFTQMRKDSSWSRPALADYILVFRKPGDNPKPITPDITNDQWIEWARPIWYGIRETDTLNVVEARENEDERHICPLQLGTIERCIRLWSNPGELVCSPFAGIGSEGYVALRHGRRFVGCELKRSYFNAAVRNLRRATEEKAQLTLFDAAIGR